MRYFFLVFMFLGFFSFSSNAGMLYWFSGSGLKIPAQRIARMFNETHRDKVVVISGGSGQVLNEMMQTRKGDIYTFVDSNFLKRALDNNVIISYKRFLVLTPIFALSKSGEKRIKNFNDLFKPGIKIAEGNPKTICLGKTFNAILSKLPDKLSAKIKKNVVVQCLNVFQIIGYVKNNTVDAGIVLDKALIKSNGFKFVNIPKSYNKEQYGYLALVRYSKHKRLSKELYNFIINNIDVYGKYGFNVLRGK